MTFIVPPAPYSTGGYRVTNRLAIGTSKPVTIATMESGRCCCSTAAAARRISVSLTNWSIGGATACVATNGSLAILAPDGSTLASTSLCKPTVVLEPVVLPVDGTYTVFINPSNGYTGSATVTVYQAVDVTGTISPGGPSVPVTISTPGQNARLTFTGSANQQVSLTLTGSTIGGTSSCSSTNGAVAILKPDGSTLGSTSLCKPDSFLDTLVLPAAGSYTVLINPHMISTGSASARLYTVVDATGTISPGGPSVPVTISTPGQNAG